jgi:hypothetical protein
MPSNTTEHGGYPTHASSPKRHQMASIKRNFIKHIRSCHDAMQSINHFITQSVNQTMPYTGLRKLLCTFAPHELRPVHEIPLERAQPHPLRITP